MRASVLLIHKRTRSLARRKHSSLFSPSYLIDQSVICFINRINDFISSLSYRTREAQMIIVKPRVKPNVVWSAAIDANDAYRPKRLNRFILYHWYIQALNPVICDKAHAPCWHIKPRYALEASLHNSCITSTSKRLTFSRSGCVIRYTSKKESMKMMFVKESLRSRLAAAQRFSDRTLRNEPISQQ